MEGVSRTSGQVVSWRPVPVTRVLPRFPNPAPTLPTPYPQLMGIYFCNRDWDISDGLLVRYARGWGPRGSWGYGQVPGIVKF